MCVCVCVCVWCMWCVSACVFVKVVFSDESMIQLSGGQRKTWTRGERGGRTVDSYAPKRQFWAALGLTRSSALVPVARVNAKAYLDTLQHHLLPLTKRRPTLKFQQVLPPS